MTTADSQVPSLSRMPSSKSIFCVHIHFRHRWGMVTFGLGESEAEPFPTPKKTCSACNRVLIYRRRGLCGPRKILPVSKVKLPFSAPADSAFKQQRLPAWQPILTAGTVLPTFFIIGIAFIPIGIGLLYFSNNVKEYVHDYTDCLSDNPLHSSQPCSAILDRTILENSLEPPCNCTINITLTENFDVSGRSLLGRNAVQRSPLQPLIKNPSVLQNPSRQPSEGAQDLPVFPYS